jgi:uncharacterized repeat protein (TIGR03803 family)
VIEATGGNFYGTTSTGGVNGYGTVFKIASPGKLTTLYSFCSQANCVDGASPYAGLIQSTDGNFYGTTLYGGANNSACGPYFCGTVFKITPAGHLTTLYSFGLEGTGPNGLVQAANRNFYGTTATGGNNSWGTVFEITPQGQLTTLYNFCSQTNCTDGAEPFAGLIQATDGNFYGTTYYGGTNPSACNGMWCGTVFKITTAGKLTTLHSFDAKDGGQPSAALAQATNGNFYGETTVGGDLTCNAPSGCGDIFSLSVGLGPFVETQPTSGKVGNAVIILGNNLKGVNRVTFNGTAAKFKVISSTEIKTTVPSGATTGFVTVTTSKKTLKSNVVFRVAK